MSVPQALPPRWSKITSVSAQQINRSTIMYQLSPHVCSSKTIFLLKKKSWFFNPLLMLVGGIPIPLKNMISSDCRKSSQLLGNIKSRVPNHQPDGYLTNQEGVWQSQLPAKTQLVQADASVLWHLFWTVRVDTAATGRWKAIWFHGQNYLGKG